MKKIQNIKNVFNKKLTVYLIHEVLLLIVMHVYLCRCVWVSIIRKSVKIQIEIIEYLMWQWTFCFVPKSILFLDGYWIFIRVKNVKLEYICDMESR